MQKLPVQKEQEGNMKYILAFIIGFILGMIAIKNKTRKRRII
jgi:hypothetical protein